MKMNKLKPQGRRRVPADGCREDSEDVKMTKKSRSDAAKKAWITIRNNETGPDIKNEIKNILRELSKHKHNALEKMFVGEGPVKNGLNKILKKHKVLLVKGEVIADDTGSGDCDIIICRKPNKKDQTYDYKDMYNKLFRIKGYPEICFVPKKLVYAIINIEKSMDTEKIKRLREQQEPFCPDILTLITDIPKKRKEKGVYSLYQFGDFVKELENVIKNKI